MIRDRHDCVWLQRSARRGRATWTPYRAPRGFGAQPRYQVRYIQLPLGRDDDPPNYRPRAERKVDIPVDRWSVEHSLTPPLRRRRREPVVRIQ